MKARFALGLLALSCGGRSSLYPGSEELETGGGTSARAGRSATGGSSVGGNGGAAGSTPLPSAGAPGGGMTNAGSGGEPQSPPATFLEFHQLGGSACNARLLDVARAPNGDIALAGNYCDELLLDDGASLLPPADGFDAFVVVLDEDMDPRWAWTIDGDFGESVHAITYLPSGHLAVRGTAEDRSSFAAELDASGKTVWSWKETDGNEYFPRSLLYDAKRGIVEVGGARGAHADPPSSYGPWNLYSARLDPLGGYLAQSYALIDGWKQTFATHGAWAAPGELVTCGWGSVGVDLEPGYVRRLSSTGTPLFTTLLETDAAVEPVDVAVDSAGDLVTGGGFHDTLRLSSQGLVAAEPGWSNEWLAKLDGTGKPRWLKSWHSGMSTQIKSVVVDQNDDILVSGVSDHALYIRDVSSEGQQRWSLDFEGSTVGDLHLITDGPDRLLLAGDGSSAQFFVEFQSTAPSIFLLRLAY